jgi:CRISPR-associated endonuclease/helicase Cas3
MPPLAHSARPDRSIPAQEYAEHIRAVFVGAGNRAHRASLHSARFGAILESAVEHAGLWHDLGKLDPANQRVLGAVSREKLPINHCDAGVAQLLREVETSGNPARLIAAFLVYAHHIGLPSFAEQEARAHYLRDESLYQQTDAVVDELVRLHLSALPGVQPTESDSCEWQSPPLFRLALSCLVDADHADTALHYRESPLFDDPPLRAVERLAALDKYVAELSKDKSDERTRLRREVYAACRESPTITPLIECDSPVGTGKTTAVMAHLLKAAIDKRLRRVFVVLPYTNIITQSVDVYRRCLVLPGEDPEFIVVAHHHKAEFSKVDSRHFTALWHAPVVVTTAVQFFQTLAGHHPATLRKLHQLAGSAIFIDESHAALPVKLWPRAWDWLKQLANDWGCHLVLGSGSLNRIWRLREVDVETPELPALIRPDVGSATSNAEAKRITFRTRPEPFALSGFAEWFTEIPGPRLVIVNTVQTAAALARHISQTAGRCKVEHISTSLCPTDRDKTLTIVKARLDPSRMDDDWTLVATSCVEAGVDISFRVGFRERCGLTSLLQTAGRVNRSNEFGSADVWDFILTSGELVAHNPAVKDGALILGSFFREDKVQPRWCTEALRREILQQYQADLHKPLASAEESKDFPKVSELFKVIDQATVTAVVDATLIKHLQAGNKVGWQEIQRGTVSVYHSKAEKFKLPLAEFHSFPELYRWNLEYNGFLGYMAGALTWLENENPQTTCDFIG